MSIYGAIGIFIVTLFAGFGGALLLKFVYDGARLNLPAMFITDKQVRD